MRSIMKTTLFNSWILLFTLSTLGSLCCINAWSQNTDNTISFATYNIRYCIEGKKPEDEKKDNAWEMRRDPIVKLIKYHQFDIFGTQEGMLSQLEYLKKELTDFDYIGKGRDDGKSSGEHSAIFYKTTMFRVLDTGDFWLSETPDKPSKGWDVTCCPRLCTWALFEELSTKKQFYVFNAHFDHQGIEARNESSLLVLQKVKDIAGKQPVVFMGDLNGSRTSKWYLTVENSVTFSDTYKKAKDVYQLSGTFNGFGKGKMNSDTIDHIFSTHQFEVLEWSVLTDTYNGNYPSDHFPVKTTMILK